MTIKQQQLHINLCSPQHSKFGKLLNHLYYNDASGFLKLAPNRDGYPHNGGEHSLRIWGDRDDCVAFIQLLAETYPKVKFECDAMMADIECGANRVFLQKSLRKRLFNKMLAKLTIQRGWDDPYPPEHNKWFYNKKFKHGVVVQVTVNWDNYTITFARLSEPNKRLAEAS